MRISYIDLSDAYYIEPDVFSDNRGCFLSPFNSNNFKEFFIQDNESISESSVIRGLHFQAPPYNQAKLIRVPYGEIMDIIVDIRTDSPTFGKHFHKILSDKNKYILYIPRGFAHGFVAIQPNSIVQYKIDNIYKPEYERGIRYDDETLNIKHWMFTNPIVAKKDRLLPAFKDCQFFTTEEYQKNPETK